MRNYDGPSWMDELIAYLKDDVLPTDKREAQKVILKSLKLEGRQFVPLVLYWTIYKIVVAIKGSECLNDMGVGHIDKGT